MNYTSLPSFPPPLPQKSVVSVVSPPTRPQRLTRSYARVLRNLIMLAGTIALFVLLLHAADVLERRPKPSLREPLPFEVVVRRFSQVKMHMTDDEVYSLLGPQRFAEFREPEMDELDGHVSARPDRYPGEHSWAKWAEPADPKRWVAVFFSGGRVYRTFERGVDVDRQ